jgi:hypothetical protein
MILIRVSVTWGVTVCLSCVRVIMMIMCILMVELLCQMVMGWPSVLKYLLSGACGHVLLGHVFNSATSQEPVSVGAYPMPKTPRRGSREPGYVLSRGDEAGWGEWW